MIVNFGYGANSYNQANIGQGFISPDAGVRESDAGGGESGQRESMIAILIS